MLNLYTRCSNFTELKLRTIAVDNGRMADTTEPELILHVRSEEGGGLPGGRIIKIRAMPSILGLDSDTIEQFAAAAGDAVRAALSMPPSEPSEEPAGDDVAPAEADAQAVAVEPGDTVESFVDEAPASVLEGEAEEPVRHKYDEPAGDLREVEEEEVMDRSEDFGDVRRVPS